MFLAWSWGLFLEISSSSFLLGLSPDRSISCWIISILCSWTCNLKPRVTCLHLHVDKLGAWLRSCDALLCSHPDVNWYNHTLLLPRCRRASRNCTICTSAAHGNTRWARRDAETDTRLLGLHIIAEFTMLLICFINYCGISFVLLQCDLPLPV